MSRVRLRVHQHLDEQRSWDNNNLPRLNAYIAKQVEILKLEGRNENEIASDIGFDRPQYFYMLMKGAMPVPTARIPAIARALRVDPKLLFRLKMEEEWKDELELLRALFDDVMTDNEKKLVKAYREVAEGDDLDVTGDVKASLRAVLKKKVAEHGARVGRPASIRAPARAAVLAFPRATITSSRACASSRAARARVPFPTSCSLRRDRNWEHRAAAPP